MSYESSITSVTADAAGTVSIPTPADLFHITPQVETTSDHTREFPIDDTRSPCLARSRAPIAMLGVAFDNVSTTETIDAIENMVASRKPHYLITANVDFLVQARADVELRKIFFDADMVLCDGTPLLWASRLLGNPLRERVAGADLVPMLIELAARKKYRLFFLGATPDAADLAVTKLKTRYPELIIAGHYSPPFARLLEMDHEEIRKQIQKAQPDLLFVCFGCPKQEKWIAMHYKSLGVPISVGVGGTLDFLSGQLKRAPVWMQRNGLEWCYRLAQEPRRLCGRYAKDLGVFGRSILEQWFRLGLKPLRKGPIPVSRNQHANADWACLSTPEHFDFNSTPFENDLPAQLQDDPRHLVLDMARTQFIDSTGIARLVALRKRVRSSGRDLVLLSPSPVVKQALAFMRLQSFFDSVSTLAEVKALLAERTRERSAAVAPRTAAAFSPLLWSGEITAANAEEVWTHTQNQFLTYCRNTPAIPRHSPPKPSFLIDMTRVRFMDSTGLGIMIRLKKLAREHVVRLCFTGLQPAVQNVIKLARLEPLLLREED